MLFRSSVGLNPVFSGFNEVWIKFFEFNICVAQSLPEVVELMLFEGFEGLVFATSDGKGDLVDGVLRMFLDVFENGLSEGGVFFCSTLEDGWHGLVLSHVFPCFPADAMYLIASTAGET